MTTAYWTGNQADLDAKKGADNFDEHGVYRLCREFGNGTARHAPVASLNKGKRMRVYLKADKGVDLSLHYPSFTEKTLKATHTELGDETKEFFDKRVNELPV